MKILLVAAAAALALSAASSPTHSSSLRAAPGPDEPDLAEVRAGAERFRDVRVALAEGYVSADMCETAAGMGQPAGLGAMGVHYFRPDLLGITAPPNPRVAGNGTHRDFRLPAILIYEPQADGSMALVAVENLVFEAAWRAAGHSERPSFHGVPYERMADDPATEIDEAHHFEPHFDRHVWLFRENPNGVFAPYNPNVSCAHAQTAMEHEAHH